MDAKITDSRVSKKTCRSCSRRLGAGNQQQQQQQQHSEEVPTKCSSKTKLFDSVLSSGKLRDDDAHCCEHGHATVVQLLIPPLHVILTKSKRVPEVSRLPF